MFRSAELPEGLRAQADLGPDWADWLDRLPRRTADLLEEWELMRDGDEVWHGFTALVLPVRAPSGDRCVLKVAYDGTEETLHESLALQRWAGNGAVRMLRADPRRRALVLERLHRDNLLSIPDEQACAVVAGLYAKLHIAAPPQFATLTSYVDTWLAALAKLPRDAPIPRRLVEQTLSLGHDFVRDSASTGTTTHGDLHYENVLAAEREPWLVIDPQPMSGDPHYEIAPMLWNRLDEVAAAERREVIRRRFFAIAGPAGLDFDRARDWVIVRMVLNAHWSIEDAERAGRPLTQQERDRITTCVTVAKAVQG